MFGHAACCASAYRIFENKQIARQHTCNACACGKTCVLWLHARGRTLRWAILSKNFPNLLKFCNFFSKIHLIKTNFSNCCISYRLSSKGLSSNFTYYHSRGWDEVADLGHYRSHRSWHQGHNSQLNPGGLFLQSDKKVTKKSKLPS